MYLREYREEDCQEILLLFYQTVHTINSMDYTKEQCDVWATGGEEVTKWNQRLLESQTIVAVQDKRIVGFGNITKTGHLDCLYVHHKWQGQGFASALCDALEKQSNSITTESSITAKPFFEKRGYRVMREQEVERQGIVLVNYDMKKDGNLR